MRKEGSKLNISFLIEELLVDVLACQAYSQNGLTRMCNCTLIMDHVYFNDGIHIESFFAYLWIETFL